MNSENAKDHRIEWEGNDRDDYVDIHRPETPIFDALALSHAEMKACDNCKELHVKELMYIADSHKLVCNNCIGMFDFPEI